MSDNVNDAVIMKSWDKLPTYHLAHAVDDHLMRTTHVIRWEEWLTSVPLHLQLFAAFGNKPPTYVHTAQILKLDNGKKRKISKSKDPESDIDYFFSKGYPKQGIINYLLTLIDSKYEQWLDENPDADYDSFEIRLEDMNSSWALVDMGKVDHVSNMYLSKVSNDHVFAETLEWAEKYKPDLAALMVAEKDYTIAAIGIERHTDKDPKRFTTFFDVENQLRFFYDNEFELLKKDKPDFPESIDSAIMLDFLSEYETALDFDMESMDRFMQLKEITKKYGFAGNNKEFRDGDFIGKVGEIAMFMRIQLAATWRTPDLFSMMKVMGKKRVFERLRDM